MSSNAYFAEICPDSDLRLAVLGCGAALALVGVVLVAMLKTAVLVRIGVGATWCWVSVREILVLRRAWRDCLAIRVAADGTASVLGADGEWQTARLVPGSMLLRRVGWLRLQKDGGPAFAECVRGDRRTNREWRRLHVIWRHIGAWKRSC